MKTLDDAKSIVSHNSPRSSIRHSKCIVDESVIIMRGGNLGIADFHDEPQTPFFQRRNTYAEDTSSTADRVRIVKHYPPLLQCAESGIICNF